MIRNSATGQSEPGVAEPSRLFEWLEPFAAPARCGCQRRPWSLVRRDDRLELRLSPEDARFSSYAAYREGFVCAGAATENLHIALYHAGFAGSVDLLPDRGDPSLLAVLRPGGHKKPSPEDEALFAYLSRPLTPTPLERRRGTVAPALLALLRHVARQHGTWLDVVADSGRRQRLEEIFLEAAELERPGLPRQNRFAAIDGRPTDAAPGECTTLTDLIGALGSSVRDAPVAAPEEDASGKARVTEAPILLILGTHSDWPLDWLLAGQALQHILLHASTHGLATTFLNAPLRHPLLRERIRGITGHAEPQVIARLDFGSPGSDSLAAPALFPVH